MLGSNSKDQRWMWGHREAVSMLLPPVTAVHCTIPPHQPTTLFWQPRTTPSHQQVRNTHTQTHTKKEKKNKKQEAQGLAHAPLVNQPLLESQLGHWLKF